LSNIGETDTATAALRFVARAVGDSLGMPTSAQQFVNSHQDILRVPLQSPPRSVAGDRLVWWDRWPYSYRLSSSYPHGTIQYRAGRGGGDFVPLDSLKNFTTETVTEKWSCDIRDIDGITASRSHLHNFTTLDELAEKDFPTYLSPLTVEQVDDLLGKNSFYSEVRNITNEETSSARFHRCMWDNGRIYLMNHTDMHPLIAARYIAGRLGQRITLHGTLHTCRINVEAAQSLIDAFDIYTMQSPQPFVDFLEMMRVFDAPFGFYGVPYGLGVDVEKANLILLPRDNKRSMRVSSVLRDAGVFNAGLFIMTTALQQPSER
jgi:hypothetical protein